MIAPTTRMRELKHGQEQTAKKKKDSKNMEKLRFNISGQEVLTFEIDHKNQSARLLASPDELASHVILTPEERNYRGIEKRLNEFQQTNQSLAEILQDIQENGFHAPMQQNLAINHSEKAIKESSSPKNTDTIVLPDTFGNTNINGLQHKDNIQIDGDAYFVKLDDLSPDVNGTWKNDFNAQYSSVSEAITSALLKNITNANELNNVLYEWREFELDGKKVTGTISKNFLQENEEEHVLAVDRKIDKHTTMTVADYAENMYDVNTEKRIANLQKAFLNTNIDGETTRNFLVQQAAFDMLVGNQDRLNNPSNFVFTYNTETQKSRLVNLDFGRALPLLWNETMEEKYIVGEYLQEDLDEFSDALNSSDNSIVSGMKRSDAIEFLNQHGFEPFEINMNGLRRDLDKLKSRILASDAPCKKYAEVKIESFKEMLNSDFSKNFYKEVSITEPVIEHKHENQVTNTVPKQFDIIMAYVPNREDISKENPIKKEQDGHIQPILVLENNGQVVAMPCSQNTDEKDPSGNSALTVSLDTVLYFDQDTFDSMVKVGSLSKDGQEIFNTLFEENRIKKSPKKPKTKVAPEPLLEIDDEFEL